VDTSGICPGSDVCCDYCGDGICSASEDIPSCPEDCAVNMYDWVAVTYDWAEVSGSGTAILLGDDDYGGPYGLTFTFPYYGNNYTDIYVGSNGFVSFGAGSTSLSNQCTVPSTTTPNNLIAAMWDDLDPGDTSDYVYALVYPSSCPAGDGTQTCAVIQYDNYHHYPGGGAIAGTWEIILYEGGDILIQFQDVGSEAGSGSTTGIEDSTGDNGVNYVCNSGTLTAGTAICFYSLSGSTGCH
jgi:hypothetical protein